MENKYYQIFTDGNIDLAASIVLKCNEAALIMNQWVLGYTSAQFDIHDQSTWKYYKNICGEYFASDIRMRITSIDSLEEIEFSKETLQYHRATKKAYGFGTTYYKELVDLYPEQEQLIRGILYPAEMDQAIAAYEGEILSYPLALVEDTEPSLMPKVQEWINGYYRRWDNIQYQNTDNLYRAAFLGILYAMMPAAIENIRKQACLTYEAHSYHVKQYLASHTKLDQYLPYMTRSQSMFFYHNLAYIEKNNGKNEIFDILLRRVFTDRHIPLGHFSLLHSTVNMPEDSLTPLAVFEKTPLNTSKNIDGIDQYSLNAVLDIEDVILPSNRKYRDDEQGKIARLATHTLNPNMPTKLLQSTVVDYTDSEHHRLGDISLQHWVWLAKKEYYQAFVTFTIPATGSRMSLNALDAFALYAYAFRKGHNLETENLPTIICNRVQRLPTASIESMRLVCEAKYVSDKWLAETRALMPPAIRMISLESFRDHLVNLFIAANEQYISTAVEEKLTARGQKEAAICRLWGDEVFSIGDYPNQSYLDWFTVRNIVMEDLSSEQLLEMASTILAEAIGSNLASVITLKDTQRAMANLFLDLSSYSIQMGLNINSGPVLDVGFPAIRTDDPDINKSTMLYYRIPSADPLDIKTQQYSSYVWDVNKYPSVSMVGQSGSKVIDYNIQGIQYGLQSTVGEFADIIIERQYQIGVGYSTEVLLTAPNPRRLTIVPGMEHFLELPLQTQLDSYVDTWAIS